MPPALVRPELGGLAVGGRVVSYGAAAGEPDPAPPPVPDLRTQNLTITGFSILNRARKAPPKDAAAGKQSHACDAFTGHGKAHQPPLPGSPVRIFPMMLLGTADEVARSIWRAAAAAITCPVWPPVAG
jgi:hypothetical protein